MATRQAEQDEMSGVNITTSLTLHGRLSQNELDLCGTRLYTIRQKDRNVVDTLHSIFRSAYAVCLGLLPGMAAWLCLLSST